MEKRQIERTLYLAKKYTYEACSNETLETLEEVLRKILREDKNNYKCIEILAKFLYSRKKYDDSIKYFKILINYKDYKVRATYGLFKCYIMKYDYKNAYIYIKDYINERNISEINDGMKILLVSFDIIFNNNYSNIDKSNLFLMNKINDEELSEKYDELISHFNKKEFSKCIRIADECEKICRKKNIKIEFETFKILLLKVKDVSTPNLYKELEQIREENNPTRMIEILNELAKFNIKNKKIFYNSLYRLVKMGYYEEVEEIIAKIMITKDNKLVIDALKKGIVNQKELDSLTEVQKENYITAIRLGRKYYREWNIETAYDVYRYGEYTTGCNVFLYYIGKMYFKAGEYGIAKKYFERYIKVGSDKLAKAYLYLATICKEHHDNKKALYYAGIVENLNKLYMTDYQMYYIYNKKNEDEDPVKMRLQDNKKMYIGFFEDEPEKLLKLKKENRNIEIK